MIFRDIEMPHLPGLIIGRRFHWLILLGLLSGSLQAAVPDQQAASHFRAQSAGTLQSLGKHAGAVDEFRQALALAEQGTDRRWQVLLQGQLGGALLAAGQADEAAQVLRSGLQNALSLGDASLQAALTNNLAHLLKEQGDTTGALARFREGIVLSQRAGNPALLAKASLGAAGNAAGTGRRCRRYTGLA